MTITASMTIDDDDADIFTDLTAATKPATAPRTPASKSRSNSAATRDSVRSAMALLDSSEALAADEVGTAPTPGTASPLATRPLTAGPVQRPNGTMYHPRMLESSTDVETLRAMRAAGLHTLLAGVPGTGKTALLEAAFGEELVTFEGHGEAEVSELVGTWVQREDLSYEWIDGPLAVAMDQGRPLFVDDATLTPSGVLARLYPAMDGRRTLRMREHRPDRVVVAQPGFVVVGAHNPGVPGAVLSEALSSRFTLQMTVSTDFGLAKDLGVDVRMVKIAVRLERLRVTGQLTWAPQMRELLGFKAVAEVAGIRVAVANILNLAPEGERDQVLSMVRTWLPDVAPLALGERA